MKTKTEQRQITTATTESRDFTIKANGKAFRILIDGLYENKTQSIVREIWSNALDSHAAAGIPERPFEVVFPSMFNPVFSVRDFGTSLSHEDMMHLYSTVFESTKEDTNVAVGKFGLGSKSPFAYTDTFAVTAIMDGEKRYYSALISEDGVPQIHFMGSEASDEETGIEVSFPIETRDIRSFCEAAKRVSHGFDVKPVVKSHEDDNFNGWPDLPVLSEGDGWKLLSGNIEGYSSRAYAKMGCVLYPINVDAIDGLSTPERKLLNSTMVIEFPVGDLEINASREALSYGSKDPTAKSILNRIRTIVDEMIESFLVQYREADTYWEACSLFRTHMGSNQMPDAVKAALKAKTNYQGRELTSMISAGRKNTSDVVLPTTGVYICGISGSKLTNQMYRFEYGSDQVGIIPREDTIVYLENLETSKPKRSAARIREAQRAADSSQIIWIKYEGGKEASEALIELFNVIDGVTIVDVDDLPEITRLTGGGGIRRPVQVRALDNGGRFDTRVDLSPEDFAKGGYYVPLERMQPQIPSQCSGPSTVWRALRECGAVEQTATLYGAPKSLWKHFEGDQWVNIYELAEDHFAKNQPKKKVAKARMIQDVLGNSTLRYLSDKLNTDQLDKSSVALAAIKFYKKVEKMDKPAVEDIIQLAKALGKAAVLEEWVADKNPEASAHVEAVKERYKMLEMFDTYYIRREVDHLNHYVQMCDKAADFDSLNEATQPVADAA